MTAGYSQAELAHNQQRAASNYWQLTWWSTGYTVPAAITRVPAASR